MEASQSLKTVNSIREKLIQLGYILGIALIIAGLIYFFAANWQGFDRSTKVVLCVGVMLLFYALSYVFAKLFQQHSFLSRLLLLAGCFGFGISVALVWQIYNAHANSYELFSVWCIVALLFSFGTRYQPLYVLSYVLFNLAAWFYFFPGGSLGFVDDGYVLGAFFAMIAANILLFVLSEKDLLKSSYLKLLSYILSHGLLIYVSLRFFLEKYALLTNSLYIVILLACFYYFLKVKPQNLYITLTGIAATFYLIIKYIEVLVEHFGPPIFIITIILGAMAVYLNVVIVKKLLRRRVDLQDEIKQQNKYSTWQNLTTILLTVLSSIVITVSLTFLISDIVSDFEDLAEMFFFMGLLLFLLPGAFMKKRNEIVGRTLISIGYLMSSIAILAIADAFLAIWLAAILFGLFRISSNGIRMLLYIMFHIVAAFKLFDITGELDSVCIALFVINVLIITFSIYRKEFNIDHSIAESIYKNSFFYQLLMFFILTFIEGSGYEYWLYVLYNVLLFIAVTVLLFWSRKHDKLFEFRISVAFWFLFLFYKYYDLVWQLLHKSVALIILGVIFVIITIWFEQKAKLYNDIIDGKSGTSKNDHLFWNGKTMLLSVLIILQLLFLGTQIAINEHALTTGTQVKLEIQPLDPRSIMQGDYVDLSYTISTLDEQPWSSNWENRWDKDLRVGQRLQLVIAPDEEGVYRYKKMYEGQPLDADEVIINGKYQGGRIMFGVEHYFVPEGTGLEVERSMKYAYVRISINGNAIMERLIEK